MKLIRSAQMHWSEPWFFLISIRRPWGWGWRIATALGFALFMGLVTFLLGPGPPNLVNASLTSLMIGGAILLILEYPNIQRDVTLFDDSIVVGSSVGLAWMREMKLGAVEAVLLRRPGEWHRRFATMFIVSTDDTYLVAIPEKVSLESLANALTRLGTKVELSGWIAVEGDTRVQIKEVIDIAAESVRGDVTVTDVAADEPKLISVFQVIAQVVMALGPLAIALMVAIGTGVWLYWNRARFGWLETAGFGLAAFAFVVATFLYLVYIGQFMAAAYGVSRGRSNLAARSRAIVDVGERFLIAVELFDREYWTKTLAKSWDYGFLEIDRARAELRFEGNKHRWTLPFRAISACRIEESMVSEGDQSSERRYYVVLQARRANEPWEVGMVFVRTEVGRDGAEQRHARAQLLFAGLADALEEALAR